MGLSSGTLEYGMNRLRIRQPPGRFYANPCRSIHHEPETFYLLAAFSGTVLPWLCVGGFFAVNGIDNAAFASGLSANGAAGGFAVDVLMSVMVFWVWSWHDSRQHHVASWWFVLPAGICVGLSLALPLYLYLRHDHIVAAAGDSSLPGRS